VLAAGLGCSVEAAACRLLAKDRLFCLSQVRRVDTPAAARGSLLASRCLLLAQRSLLAAARFSLLAAAARRCCYPAFVLLHPRLRFTRFNKSLQFYSIPMYDRTSTVCKQSNYRITEP
jgi:hypothetical protein